MYRFVFQLFNAYPINEDKIAEHLKKRERSHGSFPS